MFGAGTVAGQVPTIGEPPTAPPIQVPLGGAKQPAGTSTTPGTWYNVSSRTVVRDGWNLSFWPTYFVPMGWTGDVDANIPGTTAQAFKDAVAMRINWFRAMAGVPPQIVLDPVFSAKDQKAALMFSANGAISHAPPSYWRDYSAEGAEAAANSNICIGFPKDPGCVVTYIIDPGSNNTEAGHRRWVLYPQTRTMGTGDVPQSGPAQNPYWPANAMWVMDGLYGTPRPLTRDPYVAWPPPGFVPYQVVGPRWSLSYPNADFTTASVTMQRNGAAVPVRIEPVAAGYGENTIVWVPDNQDPSSLAPPTRPVADVTSNVTIGNILLNGVPQTFSYTVTVFDPDPSPGATFTFQSSSANVASGGGSGSASLVVNPSSTTWTAESDKDWLAIGTFSGTGTGAITWSAAASTSSFSRTATIRGGNASFTVIQSGVPCSYTLSAVSGTLPVAGGSGSFTVTASPTDCTFGSYSWSGPAGLTVTPSLSGPGVETISYMANQNTTSAPRVWTINVAGQAFTVTQLSGVPSLLIAKSHTGNFAQGQNGATYTISVSNAAGAAATTGTVTVTDTVPSGMTLVSMSGTGWSCPTGGTACMRADGLAGGSSYPPVTATVNVALNAAASLTNSATVSGGGSVAGSASDATTVTANRGLRFVPIRPCRVVDTRKPAGIFGGPAIAGGTTRNFPLWSGTCGVPNSAQAYSLNAAVVPAGRLGFLTLWPSGESQPATSILNSPDGRIKSNADIVPAGAGGAVSVFASDATHVVLDINGYFVAATDPRGLAFQLVDPCRIADTRAPAAPLGGPSIGGGQSRTLPVVSAPCKLPATAQAYSLNFTAVPKGPLGYLTTWGTGQSMPVVSTLNAPTGTVAANAALVPAGTSGSIDVFASDPTDLVIDVNGYFAPVAAGGLSLYNMTPCRVLDTRVQPGTAIFGTRDVQVSGGACGVPLAAQAVILNATVVPVGPVGYLTLWASGEPQPQVSTLNALDGAVTSNLAIVPVTNGWIRLLLPDASHLVLDIVGYFAP